MVSLGDIRVRNFLRIENMGSYIVHKITYNAHDGDQVSV